MLDYGKTLDNMNSQRQEIDTNIKKLGQKFQNPKELGKSFHEFYNYRLYLTDLKNMYKKLLNTYSQQRKTLMRDVIASFKLGRHYGVFKGDVGILPKNEVERVAFYDEATNDIDYEMGQINAFMEYVIDQITLVDRMTFGFETLYKFHEKYVNEAR